MSRPRWVLVKGHWHRVDRRVVVTGISTSMLTASCKPNSALASATRWHHGQLNATIRWYLPASGGYVPAAVARSERGTPADGRLHYVHSKTVRTLCTASLERSGQQDSAKERERNSRRETAAERQREGQRQRERGSGAGGLPPGAITSLALETPRTNSPLALRVSRLVWSSSWDDAVGAAAEGVSPGWAVLVLSGC